MKPMKVTEPEVLESILTKLTVTLEHIDKRLGKVESEIGRNREHDWKLYAYIAFGIIASITGAWTQLNTAQAAAISSVRSDIVRVESSIKDSYSQRLLPIELSLGYAAKNQESDQAAIEKIDARIRRLEELEARADERNKLAKSCQ
jgi:hypothetical protein